MASLRPMFHTLAPSLRSSPLKAAARSISTASEPTMAWRMVRPLSLQASLRPAPSAPLAGTTTHSPLQQQVRLIRSSPFRPANSSGGARRFAFASPHSAPAADAPTSFSQPGGWSRALTSLGIIVGAGLASNAFFNRETRDALHPADAKLLHSTFGYLAGGLTLTGCAAVALHRYGVSARVMAANPWLVMGVGLVASIGGMMGATSLPPGHPLKVPSWLLFNASQAAVLSPLLFFQPALLARAGLYSAAVVGSLCYVAATAKEEKFLWLGGPLLAGVTVVALSSLAPMMLPRTAFRALAVTEALSLYGGLGVFGLMILFQTQAVLKHAEMARAGVIRADPMAESIGLEMSFINLFIRIVSLLTMQNNRRK
ncbi:hypothetical protein ACQY0O_005085 [Thecaphora frezii]